MKVLLTGCAGFIGSNLTDRLLKDEYQVIGIDNFNDYYDLKVKEKNLEEALKSANFKLYKKDILDEKTLLAIFKKEKPSTVIHLAARAGVRPSIKDPSLYAKVNVLGTVNLLKLSVDFSVKKFIFGSSSSVYGNSKVLPFEETDPCQDIISPYSASKRAAEFFVESFHHTYGLDSVILRFFTVYGKRGRPDMAPALFSRAMLESKAIQLFGDGSSSRDYTYIDDIVDGIIKCINADLDFELINLGGDNPITLNNFILALEKIAKRKAKIEKLPMQPGDVEKTWANIIKAKTILDWKPKVNLEDGLKNYTNWLSRK